MSRRTFSNQIVVMAGSVMAMLFLSYAYPMCQTRSALKITLDGCSNSA